MDYTKRYKQVLLVAIALALGALLWLLFALHPNNFGSLAGAMAALGLTALALTPVCLELSVEVQDRLGTGNPKSALANTVASLVDRKTRLRSIRTRCRSCTAAAS